MSKGISKGITKENIVNTTLELIRNRENIRGVNLREIARELGCAHTNLYNYFSDLDGILWEAVDEILLRSYEFINEGIDSIEKSEDKLEHFYKKCIDFYLENRGWFRLFWIEKLHWNRPEKNKRLTNETVDRYVELLKELFAEIFETKLTKEQVMHFFHTIHCYIYGEISIYISGRGLISDERQFKEYVLGQCVHLSRLMVTSPR